jgi:hypothetical protein
LPDFSGYNIPKRGENIPNYQHGHKIFQGTVKHSKCPENIPTFLPIPRPSNIYPNWDFWYEKIPPGNADDHTKKARGLKNVFPAKI